MAADDFSPVNLLPVASTSDAPPRDSRRQNESKNGEDKSADTEKLKGDERHEQSLKTGDKQPASTAVDFEHTEHELDHFA
jgi:hypothetical protein